MASSSRKNIYRNELDDVCGLSLALTGSKNFFESREVPDRVTLKGEGNSKIRR